MIRFVGESEGALRRTFAEASLKAPCLIVFDEVDTLCPRRDEASSEAQRRVVSTMLALLDGVDAKEQVCLRHRPLCYHPLGGLSRDLDIASSRMRVVMLFARACVWSS